MTTAARWTYVIARSIGPLPLALYRRANPGVFATVLPPAPGEAQLRLARASRRRHSRPGPSAGRLTTNPALDGRPSEKWQARQRRRPLGRESDTDRRLLLRADRAIRKRLTECRSRWAKGSLVGASSPPVGSLCETKRPSDVL